jgi:hypothetical protein
MRAVDQWSKLQRTLPEGWEEARVSFVPEERAQLGAAAAVLAPLGPGRASGELRFSVRGSGVSSPQSVRNLLGRLDAKRVWGALSLLDVQAGERVVERAQPERASLAATLDTALDDLPPDWRDLLCDLELDSTDYLPRAALLGAPLNPSRVPGRIALQFRVSRRGYGTAPSMARRCFERMDAEPITGKLSILNALSETDYVATLGPVWRIAGRSV